MKEAKGRGLMVQEQERFLMPRGLRPVAIEGVCYDCLLLACNASRTFIRLYTPLYTPGEGYKEAVLHP